MHHHVEHMKKLACNQVAVSARAGKMQSHPHARKRLRHISWRSPRGNDRLSFFPISANKVFGTASFLCLSFSFLPPCQKQLVISSILYHVLLQASFYLGA